MQDLILAMAHHAVVFAIFGVLFGEFVVLGGTLNVDAIGRLVKLDRWFGILAAAIIIVGVVRVVYAAKGWDYYSRNAFFWAKLGAFALVGLLSIVPTVNFIRWKRSGTVPATAALQPIRVILHFELTLMILVPVFAAAMARGYGQL